MNRIIDWLRDNSPVWCAACGKVVRRKNAIYERTTMGAFAPLCQECHERLFRPFSRGGK